LSVRPPVGCDRSLPTAPVATGTPSAQVIRELRAAGYRGPVIVAERTPQDGRGTGRTTLRLFLPKPGLAVLARAHKARLRTLRLTLLKNVLLLKVEGIKPGTTSTAIDADRFTFTLPAST
jgi:hypothetical protein